MDLLKIWLCSVSISCPENTEQSSGKIFCGYVWNSMKGLRVTSLCLSVGANSNWEATVSCQVAKIWDLHFATQGLKGKVLGVRAQWYMWLAQSKRPTRCCPYATCTFFCQDAHLLAHRKKHPQVFRGFCSSPIGRCVRTLCMYMQVLFCVCVLESETVSFSQLLRESRFPHCNSENNAERLAAIRIWYSVLSRKCFVSISYN